jgi:hypothetical protein
MEDCKWFLSGLYASGFSLSEKSFFLRRPHSLEPQLCLNDLGSTLAVFKERLLKLTAASKGRGYPKKKSPAWTFASPDFLENRTSLQLSCIACNSPTCPQHLI